MKVYVEDSKETKYLVLFNPTSRVECAIGFMRFFKEFPFEKTTAEERRENNTDAYFKTDAENFDYWSDMLEKMQNTFDKAKKTGNMDALELKGLPIFVKPRYGSLQEALNDRLLTMESNIGFIKEYTDLFEEQRERVDDLLNILTYLKVELALMEVEGNHSNGKRIYIMKGVYIAEARLAALLEKL
jgi:hypothetical protein